MKKPEQPLDIHDIANELARNVANWREVLAPLDEATAGYRVQLEADGWSPAAAEQMAISFHTLQMSVLAQHVNNAFAQADT